MSAAAALTPDRPAWGRTPAGRMSERFVEPEEHKQAPVVWTDGSERVLVHIDSMRITEAGGWLRCDVELELEPTPVRRRRVRIALQAGLKALSGSLLSARERLRVTPWTRARDGGCRTNRSVRAG